MGLAAGLLHSLDADHIAAVVGMSGPQTEGKNRLAFPLYWAAGHGGAIVIIAISVLLLGLAVPHRMSEFAESVVPYMLIAIGMIAWIQLVGERGRFQRKFNPHTGTKKATVVGLVHGCAGSAPVLALLPAATLQSPITGFIYVLLFCFGVAFSMLFLGRILALTAKSTTDRSDTFLHWLRCIFATLPIVLGVYLVLLA